MRVRLTRGKSVLGGATLALGLGVASMASACVPSVDNSNFAVKDPGTGNNAVQGTSGQRLRAVGNNIQMPGWEYTIKLHASAYDHAAEQFTYNMRCGNSGSVQTLARTTGVPGPTGSPKGTGTFDQEFLLNTAGSVGDAHFCAIPQPHPALSLATMGWTGSTMMYVYSPFTIV